MVEYSEGTPSLFNEPELAERLRPVLSQTLGDENIEVMEPSMGGEDFGRYGRAGVPILMMSVGSVDQRRLDEYQSQGGVPSLHSSRYYPDIEPTFRTGVTVLISSVEDLLPSKK